MSRHRGVSQWVAEVSTRLPELSHPQARVLACWSYGIVVAQSCGLTSVASLLALLLRQKETTVRQRLREWYWDAPHKCGDARRALDVTLCFAPLLRWLLALWEPHDTALALALDATTLRDRFVVLSISVVYRGCAIPVAWTVRGAHQPGAWRPEWERLLAALAPAVPADWHVLVLADSGLYARWLFRAIVAHGWHPSLRIDETGRWVRPVTTSAFVPLASLVPEPGHAWYGVVDCFATRKHRLRCTLLAHWHGAHQRPWFLLTDLAPQEAAADWYRMRAWIENGFKDLKRGGWHWEHTRMIHPARVERLWLALALATLLSVSLGSAAEDIHPPPINAWTALPRRTLSCVRRGTLLLIVSLADQTVPLPTRLATPWPDGP